MLVRTVYKALSLLYEDAVANVVGGRYFASTFRCVVFAKYSQTNRWRNIAI